MGNPNSDRSRLVAATANRLRSIQADFADESVEVREQYLAEVVDQALAKVNPEDRSPFLDDLRILFPTWDAHQEVGRVKGDVAAGTSSTDQREWEDVSFVLERLIELTGSLPEDQKMNIAGRLQEAGLASVSDVYWPQQTVDQLRAFIKLPPDQPLDAHRVLEMVIFLSKFADSLDQLGWKIWKAIAPKSRLRSSAPMKDTMLRFVQGQSDVPMSRNIEDLRHLVASLLSSIAQIGGQFAQQHQMKFAPSSIEEFVKDEKSGGWLKAFDVRCWEKYKELTANLDDAVIEREIMQIIERFVSSINRGR